LYCDDERRAAPDHPDSNYGMTRNHLIDKVFIPEENIFRMHGEINPEKASTDYSACLKNNLPQKNNLPYFHLTVLGMGDDGHTASIFPDEMYLWNSHNLCEVAAHPQTGQKRITLTGSTINNSKQIVFLVTGKSKALIANEILNKTGNYMLYPASLVNQKRTTWFMDREAAMLLKN
jgi:6-phosphogluconolactonase